MIEIYDKNAVRNYVFKYVNEHSFIRLKSLKNEIISKSNRLITDSRNRALSLFIGKILHFLMINGVLIKWSNAKSCNTYKKINDFEYNNEIIGVY